MNQCRPAPRVSVAPVYGLFFLAGAVALIYEISWARQVGLLFGHTARSAAITLGAYFGGMGLGYALAPRFIERVGNPLRAYGFAELVAGGWALVIPLLLKLVETPRVATWLSPEQPVTQVVLRAAVAFLVLLPATVAMGTTLPCVAVHLAGSQAPSHQLALAYGFNILGAVSGVLSATFVLLLELGVRGSSYFAAALSAGAGIVALLLPAQRRSSPEAEPATNTIHTAWYAIVALTGAATLALEVLYTHMFALALQNSTYTFGVVLAAFLVGLSLGSVLSSRRTARFDPLVYIGRAALAIPLFMAAGLVVFAAATEGKRLGVGGGFGLYLVVVGCLAGGVILPVAIALGTILPSCWAAVHGNPGRTAGSLTAVNTLAAAIGSVLTSFALLPVLGLWLSFTAVACAFSALAWFALRGSGTRAALALGVAGGIAAPSIGLWLPRVYPGYDAETYRVVGRWESAYGLIDVLEDRSTRRLDLRHNGLYRLSSSDFTSGELREGHVPLLLHRTPEHVLYLGLASGITASSAIYHPEVRRAEVVELIPDMVPAAGKFARYNGDVLASDKMRIHLNDARHFLQGQRERYDVIVSAMFIPWESKTGYLYTVEHYRNVHARLREGGLFCQWIHLWEVADRELELILDSLSAVFPNVILFKENLDPDVPILGIVGSDGPVRLSGRDLARRLRALAGSPSASKGLFDPSSLLDLYIGAWPRRKGATLNTDEHPRVEFQAPLAHKSGALRSRTRVLRYYERVLTKLELTGLEYEALPGADYPDLGRGRRVQIERLRRP